MQEDFDLTAVCFLPRREAAVLAAERQCSRAGVSWEAAEGNGGMLKG